MLSRFSSINIKLVKTAALAALLSLGVSTMQNAMAQNFDTSSVAVSDASPQAAITSTPGNGNPGDIGRTSYKTGESPSGAGLSGNTSNYSTKQLGNALTNHLTLPYAGTGGLAPVFGLGNQISGNGQFTTILNDPIRVGTGVAIDPTTGAISTRTGTTVTTVGGLNGGNPYASANSLGSSAAVLGAESAVLNSSLSGSFFNGSLFSGF